MMNHKTSLALMCAVLLTIAGVVQAVTVTQNLSVDPWSNGWTKAEVAGADLFTYNTSNLASVPGYLDVTLQRSTTALGQAYVPLDKTYYMPQGQNGAATASDIWIGFDLGFGGSASTQQFMVGLFNSSQTHSNSSTINSLGLELTKAAGGLRVRSETINATGGLVGTSTNTTMASLADSVSRRYQAHFYMSGGKMYADVKVGTFNDATGALTANVFTQNGILLFDSNVSWDTVGLNALGMKNLYMGTSSGKYGKFNIDNLYFSTDGEQSMSVPSWVVPEPATIAMISIGSLMAIRKRKA